MTSKVNSNEWFIETESYFTAVGYFEKREKTAKCNTVTKSYRFVGA